MVAPQFVNFFIIRITFFESFFFIGSVHWIRKHIEKHTSLSTCYEQTTFVTIKLSYFFYKKGPSQSIFLYKVEPSILNLYSRPLTFHTIDSTGCLLVCSKLNISKPIIYKISSHLAVGLSWSRDVNGTSAMRVLIRMAVIGWRVVSRRWTPNWCESFRRNQEAVTLLGYIGQYKNWYFQL